MTKRTLLGGAAALTAGGTLLTVVGEPVSAQVTVDSFDVSPAEFTAEQANPILDVTAAFRYDAGVQPVRALRLALSVGGDVIATDELVTDAATADSTTTLSGRVTDSSAWAAEDFAPAVASSVDRSVTVGLSFEVLADGDDVIVSDSAEDTATLTIHHPQESQYVAEVGGSGQFRTASE
jgi:hypothetical protein